MLSSTFLFAHLNDSLAAAHRNVRFNEIIGKSTHFATSACVVYHCPCIAQYTQVGSTVNDQMPVGGALLLVGLE